MPKRLFGLVYTLEIPISTAFKKVDLSPKRLNLGPRKTLETKNPSLGFKKQYQPSLNLKRLRFIKLQRKQKRLSQLQLQTRLIASKKLYPDY